jgi:SAM-dependent methyltransferase
LAAIEAAYQGYVSTDRYRLWAEDSPGYRRLASQLLHEIAHVLSASIEEAGRRVLDAGCGSGDMLAVAKRAGLSSEWTGVDLRREAIQEARAAHPGARFMEASADAMPLPDAAFDVVVAKVLFSSLPSQSLEEAVAAEISRVLRPGGWLVWLDLRFSNPSNQAVHGLPIRHVHELFPDWPTELRVMGLLPPVARRLGRGAPVLYPILSAFSPLRSHVVGRLRRPELTSANA